VARQSSYVSQVFVSTDDPEIAQIAIESGASVPFLRPAELAGDDSPEWMAWRHAIQTLSGTNGEPVWDGFLAVPATAPLRMVEDLDRCVATLLAGDVDVVITARPAERSPYFNMVTIDPQGYARLAMQPSHPVFRRQDAPAIFDVTTVAYAARPDFVLQNSGMHQGRIKAVVVSPEHAIDIDTELDFEIAEFLMRRREARQ
jgi:N-acylneuraminate cytidylyltransferase